MSDERRDLILARVGGQSLHPTWTAGCDRRSWDLQLSSYAADDLYADDGDLPLSIDRGTKFDSIHRYLTSHPEVFDRYDYICLPDDDLRISGDAIHRLLETCREFDLWLAQPSHAWDSFYGHAITLNSPRFRLRYTNFVEAQWPCFRSDYLKQLLSLIEGRYSGWGIDLVWALLMREPMGRCAVVDEVSMVHTRPHFTGDIYPALKGARVEPRQEMREVLASYESSPRQHLVYGGVLTDGRVVGAARARAVNGTHLARGTLRSRKRAHTLYRGLETIASVVTHARSRPRTLVPVTGAAGGAPRARD